MTIQPRHDDDKATLAHTFFTWTHWYTHENLTRL